MNKLSGQSPYYYTQKQYHEHTNQCVSNSLQNFHVACQNNQDQNCQSIQKLAETYMKAMCSQKILDNHIIDNTSYESVHSCQRELAEKATEFNAEMKKDSRLQEAIQNNAVTLCNSELKHLFSTHPFPEGFLQSLCKEDTSRQN